MYSKAYLLKIGKTSKDQTQTFTRALQNSFSEKNQHDLRKMSESCFSNDKRRFSNDTQRLPCDFAKKGLHHGHFPRNVPTFLKTAFKQNNS